MTADLNPDSSARELESLTRVLVVSPHFDDAALSAWALIDRASPGTTDVVTAFGGMPGNDVSTSSDHECGFADGVEALHARRAEDDAALADITGRHWWLPLLDRQYLDGSRDASDEEAIVRAVTDWIRDNEVAGAHLAIAVPAGAGAQVLHAATHTAAERSRPRGGAALGWLRTVKHRLFVWQKRRALDGRAPAHPDHLFVRDAILNSLDRMGVVQVLLYEELPYLWSVRADAEVASACEHRGLTAIPFDVPVDRVRKQQRMSSYASQLGALDPSGRLHDAALLPPTERYWKIL